MNYFFYSTKKILGIFALKIIKHCKDHIIFIFKIEDQYARKKFINDKEMISIKLF